MAKNNENKENSSPLKGAVEYFFIIVAAVLVGLFVNFFLIVNARIPTSSMENTIMAGDRVFGNRLAYKNSDPERYDIIIFKYPDNEKVLYIKRTIGLPGETVIVKDGVVYVHTNDVDTSVFSDEELYNDPRIAGDPLILDDSFCPETPLGGDAFDGVFRVPEGHFFMLGDNRNHSKDSRFWDNTYLSKDKIIGKAIVRYWPINKIKLLKYEVNG